MKDMAFRPIDVMGHGFYRAGTIATSIISAHQGLALIDEMDDGLHYSTLKDVWRVVLDLAQRHDVQVFATTQSLECVQAAAEAAGGRPDVLALHRLTRRDGDIVVTAVEDEGIRAAVGFGFELR